MRLIINKIALIVLCAFITVPAVLAQQVRIALKGDAYIIKEEKYAGLEVDGEVLIPVSTKYWVNFSTSTGKYFVAETENGTFNVLDRKGKQVKLGDYRNFYKASVVDGTIMTQATKDSPPKYFSENNLSIVEVKVEQAEADFFDKDRVFNPEKMTRDKAVEQSKLLSAQVEPHGKFEIRQKANSQRQELVVDGKVLWEAQEIVPITDAKFFNKTTCWGFIVKNGGLYGTYGLSLYMKDGKKCIEHQQFIPYEYTFIRADAQPGIVRCTTKSSTLKLKAWTGQDVK